ncbi:peptidylprolyl isomerase, partial [Bacteroidota bacterium]
TLVAIVIGIALFAFILGDFIGKGQQGQNPEVAVINGETIDYAEYQEFLTLRMNYYMRNANKTSVNESEMLTVRAGAWEDIKNEYILKEEYSKLGLNCSDDELFDLVAGENILEQIKTTTIFQDTITGVFDRNLVINFLQNLELYPPDTYDTWVRYEQDIKANSIVLKFNSLVEKALYTTDKYAATSFIESNKKYDFQYILKRYLSVNDTLVSFTEQELKDYYNENKNKFQQTASRDIEYVSFDVFPSQEDKLAAEKWINDIQNDFKESGDGEQFIRLNSDGAFDHIFYKKGELAPNLDEFMFGANEGDILGPYLEDNVYKIARLNKIENLPDSVKASHILINPALYGNNMVVTQAIADSLKELIINGADFAELAKEHGTDATATNGGDLGWFKYGGMIREFAEPCFFGKKGDVLTTVSGYGVHVVKIYDQGKLSKYVQTAILEKNIVAGDKTENQVYAKAGTFAAENSKSNNFQEGIIEEGLTKRVAPNLGESDNSIPGIESSREMIRWAFGAKLGEVSKIFKFPSRFIVAQLSQIHDEGTSPFEQVRADIEREIIKKKKAEKIIEEMNTALEKGLSFEDLALETATVPKTSTNAYFTSTTITGIGVEPKLSAALFLSEKGKISKPIEGNQGVYVFTITNIIEPVDNDYTAERERLTTAFLNIGKYRAVDALEGYADIKDYRFKVVH